MIYQPKKDNIMINNRIIKVLNIIAVDKSGNDYCLLLTFINYMNNDKVVFKQSINNLNSVTYYFMNNYDTISITFYKDNVISIMLPLSGTFFIKDCYNTINYQDITKLIGDNNND